MANRRSRQVAEQVKAGLEAKGYDNIVIIDNSYPGSPSFNILQEVTCRDCGKTVHTRAIGEIGNNICADCENKAANAWRSKRYESKQSWAERFERE